MAHLEIVTEFFHLYRQLPWMQYDEGQLWISTLNTIKCYRVRYNGTVTEDRRKRLQLNEDDVSRFVVKNNKAVSGCRYVTICYIL